jgi:hypothetical protein
MAQADTIVPGGVQGLDRYAYVNNSPLNYVDPTGHVACDEIETTGYACRIKMSRLAVKHPTVIILVCGVGTGEKCENNDAWDDEDDGYHRKRPLSDYERWADENGIRVKYFGFKDGDTIEDVRDRIVTFMEDSENAGKSFILIGHSAGADAAWNATLNQVEKENPSRISGVLLLDAGAMDIDRGIMDSQIQSIISKGIDIRSFSSHSYRIQDQNGKGTFITLPEITSPLSVEEHKSLAVNDGVLFTTLPIIKGWLLGN